MDDYLRFLQARLNRADKESDELAETNPLRSRTNFPAFRELCGEDEIDTTFYKEDIPGSGHYVRGRHWCFMGEIVNDTCSQLPGFFNRNRIFVRDVSGDEEFNISFYHDPFQSMFFDFTALKNGHTICIRYAERHQFMDGSVGVRVEHLKNVLAIRTDLKNLFEISEINPLKKQHNCWQCSKSESNLEKKLFKCSRCKYAKYCDKSCQTKDWPNHKKHCKFIADFIKLTDLKFDQYEDSIPFINTWPF